MEKKCSFCGKESNESSAYCESCGNDFPNQQVQLLNNRYQIIRTVKSGGMGCVFQAKDTRLDTIVAIKKMTPFYKDQQEKNYAEQRFIEEAKILSRLHHGGLPKVIDYFTEEDGNGSGSLQYLVMTFVEGHDLETLLKQKWEMRPPIDVLMDYFRQVLEILSYLHSQNPPVIYRDMKPSNIMVQFEPVQGGRAKHPNGRLFLVDFGIARVYNPESTGTLIGTPGYAAPEQYQGFTEPRSDLYSLGVLMHFMLTGQNPADGTRPPFTFEPIEKFNKKSPRYLNSIIMSMIDLVAAKRPSSADDILEAMDRQGAPAKKISPLRPHKPVSASAGTATGTDSPTVVRMPGRDSVSINSNDTQITQDSGVKSAETGYTAPGQSSEEEPLIFSDDFYPSGGKVSLPPAVEGADIPTADDELLSVSASDFRKPGLPISLIAFLSVFIIIAGLFAFSPGFKRSAAELLDPGDKSGIPLHSAAYKGDIKKVTELISNGASVNETDSESFTALHKAALKGRVAVAELLILRGADVNQPTKWGVRPLFIASKRGDYDMVKMLLKHKADPNLKDINDVRPIHGAVESGNTEVVRLLIDNGANLNVATRSGDTPLFKAKQKNNADIENLLINKGAK